MTHTRAMSFPRRCGFTLIEMLIVIGIVLVLSALTVMVTASAFRASEIRTTQRAIDLLESAVGEWELAAERQVSYGRVNDPDNRARYDISQTHIEGQGSDPEFHFDDTIFDLIQIIERNEMSRSILANIDPELLQQLDDPDSADPDDTRLGIRDAWDKPIRVVFPGRTPVEFMGDVDPLNDDGFIADKDGTARNLMEITHGEADSRRIYFTSAGPDGLWGHLHLDIEEDGLDDDDLLDIQKAADNLYSYDVNRTRR